MRIRRKPAAVQLALATAAALLNAHVPTAAADSHERPFAITEKRERCSDYDPNRQPFFGDTHVHTAYSFDAASQDTRNTPRDAYRFAKGAKVGLQPYGEKGKALRSAQLRRPLDFTAISDHASMLGEVRICDGGGDAPHPSSNADMCWVWHTMGPLSLLPFASKTLLGRERFLFCGDDGAICREAATSVWGDIQKAAEAAYDRSAACAFTSFVGYEWTASLDQGTNLHRNVIFRNASVPDYPLSWVETPSAWALWDGLQQECLDAGTGCDVLTIPHNSNLSGAGLMFESAKLTGVKDANQKVTADEARRRQRFEPIVEIMQHKGDSECLLGGDTTDEACAFEKLPYDTFAGVQRLQGGQIVGPPTDADQKGMVREALKKGLVQEASLGSNPLKYGIIASTDTHLGTPGLVLEDASKGHGGAGNSATNALPVGLPDNVEFSPGGLAVVWAEENSRDALFEGMLRRETYGTSGPRPIVRFFGGWEYASGLCDASDFAARGYAGGVPMGGDLPKRPAGAAAPVFAVHALKDAGTKSHPGTPLQRIQVVKGWVEGGKAREKVYDVAGGDNGATVDTKTCEPRGEGAAMLCEVWKDPDFHPKQRAFYYARVLENPTCRWSQRLCNAGGVDCSKPETVTQGYAGCCTEENRASIQERAWTSPIWYTP